jgi:hypothetical protein
MFMNQNDLQGMDEPYEPVNDTGRDQSNVDDFAKYYMADTNNGKKQQGNLIESPDISAVSRRSQFKPDENQSKAVVGQYISGGYPPAKQVSASRPNPAGANLQHRLQQ